MFSKRLINISKLIKDDGDAADIGSDHGFLIEILLENGFKHHLLGVENKVGPYKNLEKTFLDLTKKYDNVRISLSDGLNEVDENYSTIVLAGMGFNNIKTIIENNTKKLNHINRFVIDCHTEINKVRSFFVNLGYEIEDEMVVYEDEIYYDLISFVKSNKSQNYSSLELKYGPINLKNRTTDFLSKIRYLEETNNNLLSKINDTNRKNEILKEITELKEILYEN